MILQELYRYYERKKNEGDIAPPGYEYKEIPYIIVIDKDGSFVRFESTIYEEEKKKRARMLLVPAAVKRSSGVEANLLWDNLGYILGIADGEKQTDAGRLKEQKKSFYAKIKQCSDETGDNNLNVVLAFAKVPRKELQADALWKEIIARKTGANLTFQIKGQRDLICAGKKIEKYLSKNLTTGGNDVEQQKCLVTGDETEIEKLHPAIKGVLGAQTTGANIVSFNQTSFISFGKTQSFNAPVGKYAAFAYTTSLNTMLAKDSNQKLTIGDTSVVFWAEKKTDLENNFGSFFSFQEDTKKDEENAEESMAVASIRRLLESAQNGKQGSPEKDTLFYVLGLAPNASRIAIRFWHQETVSEIENNLRQYFIDLQIVHPASENDVLPLWLLLKSTAVLGKNENIHPLMASGLFEAILTNGVFPRIVLTAIIGRIRAEPEASRKFEYCRAALLKAYINRVVRSKQYSTQLLEEKMDEKNTNSAYRLGRLFAVLENLQGKAIGNPNASIRDRYYASASSRPATVFPMLLNMTNHHISKLKEGGGIWGDKLIQDILSVFPAERPFPKVMAMEEQGLFAVGYYQQKQWLYTKKEER
ncbi:MAG: type I-C CRISPR-associated protein Cas8c/Csd1 [Spirochaetes bacterium]|nr:type I-C CRISPR-associated protein Cas8c/Csd1 [Spirochaetota bacterium]